MRNAFALAALLCFSGCLTTWDASWALPVVAVNATPAELAALTDAVAEWNDALPVDVFVMRSSTEASFYVQVVALEHDLVEGQPELAGRTANVKSRMGQWSTITYRRDLPDDVRRPMFAHELGHVLLDSMEHSTDPASIMFERYVSGAHVSESDARAVSDFYGLGEP
jgi:hypothetical protein